MSERFEDRLASIEARQHDTAVLLAEAMAELRALRSESAAQVERWAVLEREIRSTDEAAPGIAVRLDRLTRRISTWASILGWIGGGGLAGLAGTLYLLKLVLDAVQAIGPP